ncbi:MAG: hypothetical protein C0622_00990 [Desulfuromonas sp.]|nr:MAG: hypothetical protein C0622_00990 [Desulfuromonas sp.]
MHRFTVLFIAAIFVLLQIPSPALAFKSSVRCQMIRDAIAFAPAELQLYLVSNFDAVHKGIHLVDLNSSQIKEFNPYDAEKVYLALIENIRQEQLCSYNTAHRFGVLAGYLAESVSPSRHSELRDLIPGKILYDGQHPVQDIRSSLSRIVRDYRNPYLGKKRREVTDFLYTVAVNEIVDHWVSAWQAGGLDAGEIKMAGFDIRRARQADLLRGVSVSGGGG